jgi:hypothetical protein
MTMPSKFVKHDQTIRDLRAKGVPVRRIAEALGEKRSSLAAYIARQEIPSPPIKRPSLGMAAGHINWRGGFTVEQLRTLEKLAREWGCDTLSETASEILRDYLDEHAANGNG